MSDTDRTKEQEQLRREARLLLFSIGRLPPESMTNEELVTIIQFRLCDSDPPEHVASIARTLIARANNAEALAYLADQFANVRKDILAAFTRDTRLSLNPLIPRARVGNEKFQRAVFKTMSERRDFGVKEMLEIDQAINQIGDHAETKENHQRFNRLVNELLRERISTLAFVDLLSVSEEVSANCHNQGHTWQEVVEAIDAEWSKRIPSLSGNELYELLVGSKPGYKLDEHTSVELLGPKLKQLSTERLFTLLRILHSRLHGPVLEELARDYRADELRRIAGA